MPPGDAAAKVRILTPRVDLPGTVHPNDGTAFVLGQCGKHLQLEKISGLVRIELTRTSHGARPAAPQPLAVAKAQSRPEIEM